MSTKFCAVLLPSLRKFCAVLPQVREKVAAKAAVNAKDMQALMAKIQEAADMAVVEGGRKVFFSLVILLATFR